MRLLKKAGVVSLLAGIVVVLTGSTAWAQAATPIDIGDSVSPFVGAVMAGIVGAFTELAPIMIPALIALGVFASVIGWIAVVKFRKKA